MIKKSLNGLILSLLPTAVLAQSSPTINIPAPANQNTRFSSFPQLISWIIQIALIAGGIAFLFMLIFGGIQYLTAAGNEDNAKKANRTMLYAAIGLIIIAVAYAVARWVVKDLLGITGVFA